MTQVIPIRLTHDNRNTGYEFLSTTFIMTSQSFHSNQKKINVYKCIDRFNFLPYIVTDFTELLVHN